MLTTKINNCVNRKPKSVSILGGIFMALIPAMAVATDTLPNACPVDGCEVKIVSIAPAGDELELTYEANFTPDNSKNHFHVWWGENFTVEQVGRSAETVYGVTQGRWHRHDDYPTYITTGAASTSVREEATTLCVSAGDRDHNIIDVNIFHCVSAADHL